MTATSRATAAHAVFYWNKYFLWQTHIYQHWRRKRRQSLPTATFNQPTWPAGPDPGWDPCWSSLGLRLLLANVLLQGKWNGREQTQIGEILCRHLHCLHHNILDRTVAPWSLTCPTKPWSDSLGVLVWSCMRYVSPVSVSPAVDGRGSKQHQQKHCSIPYLPYFHLMKLFIFPLWIMEIAGRHRRMFPPCWASLSTWMYLLEKLQFSWSRKAWRRWTKFDFDWVKFLTHTRAWR